MKNKKNNNNIENPKKSIENENIESELNSCDLEDNENEYYDQFPDTTYYGGGNINLDTEEDIRMY